MPTVKRFGSVRVCVYADDHAPPHFHLIGRASELLVRIEDMTVVQGSTRDANMGRALAWAREHRDALLAIWAHLNDVA